MRNKIDESLIPLIPVCPMGTSRGGVTGVRVRAADHKLLETLAESGRAGIEFEDFTDAELKAKLRPQSLAAKSVADAMLAVRGLTLKSNAVRRYGVSKNGSTYVLKVK